MSLWSHSVLALLSEGCPHLRGRLPMYYSPVCHCTHGRSHFLVRLACIRHAASVRSEPGSNSSVKSTELNFRLAHNLFEVETIFKFESQRILLARFIHASLLFSFQRPRTVLRGRYLGGTHLCVNPVFLNN
jgi:hypothetical protein